MKMTLGSVVLCLLLLQASAYSQTPVSLIDTENPLAGWKFGNGPEFPGAKGKLVAAEPFREHPALSLQGDFEKGGNYVQAEIALPNTPVDTVSFWINVAAGANTVPIRLIDGTDQCHQLKIKLNDKGGWQQVVLPVEQYFKKMGTNSALDIAAQYERWGGAQDGKWHQPGKLFVILLPRTVGSLGEIRFSEVVLKPSRPTTAVEKTIPLDELLAAGEVDWDFNLGQEFPGAKGGLSLATDLPEAGHNAMRLQADFTGGGAYVGIRKSFAGLDVQSLKVIRLKMRSDTTKQFGLRLVDSTGQCHQQKAIPFTADGKWHEVELVPSKLAGGEHWDGANDGKWHGSVRMMELMLNGDSSAARKSDLLISSISADVVIEARAAPAAFHADFETDAVQLRETWRTAGDVALVEPGHKGSAHALALRRTLATLRTDTSVAGPVFAVSPGAWQVQYAWKSDLHSPDNSFQGSVALEVLNQAGGTLEKIPLGIGFGKQDWQLFSKSIVLPAQAAQAKFGIELQKTYGTFLVDELSASRLSVQPIERRVDRIRLATKAVGNLFVPGEPVAFQVTVEAVKPLSTAQQTLRYSVRDYWGAEQFEPGSLALNRQAGRNGRFLYTAEILLPSDRLAIGKFQELHVEVPEDSGEPTSEYSGLAVLPPAVSRNFPPEQVPFTIRNWDSRIPEYFRLADRLGLRLMGVWGTWSAKAPYAPDCPGVELCKELGAKWVTGTPAAEIERNGFKDYSEESLRKGMRNFLEAYAHRGLAMIAQGNEPHGTGDKVLDNVRAYRAIYETVKAFDPQIHVLGTSVEPNEEYFKAGYQKYLDSYDFHIYEHYNDVRRTIREYRALMQKYDAVKPIHSTELGLNSQGQTRLAVAREMIKKSVVFFAEGGATVSWFTIQYPDPEGKARGQFGDSHCVFDCKYSLYNPRLDAISYYNIVNGICVKKFVDEAHYPGGAQAYLFRDDQNDCLQVLWSDGRREDVAVPFPANQTVELVRIDGSRQMLVSTADGITLTLSEDPVLLLYKSDTKQLAKTLNAPALSLAVEADATDAGTVAPGAAIDVAISGKSLKPSVLRLEGPSSWKSELSSAGSDRVTLHVEVPAATTARQGQFYVQLLASGKVTGEITVPVIVAPAQ